MISAKQKQKEYLEENFNLIITKINSYFELKQGFILSDLIEKEKNNYYYIYITKGILLALLNSNHIEIFAMYGNKNYMYKSIKKINLLTED